ncbi:MAG TPA: RsmE family RNA methyltransferase [Gemmatimonadaceae bacterium]|nr:RsmE family RNA methyltransferase [Gemmatimonadaceae bacterium]
MERRARTVLATFYCPDPMAVGRVALLGEAEARHVKVRRLATGERVRLVDGAGTVATGLLLRIARMEAAVELDDVRYVEPLPALHLIAPVADRERMLLLAEKATELGAASWRPILWRRSRAVSPRGEGITFNGKVRARMIAALTQSGGAWLPAMHPEAQLEAAVAAAPAGERWLLDADGESATLRQCDPPVTVAVGPEGGIEPAERDFLIEAGFLPVKVAPLTLRFETAAIAGLSLARAAVSRAPREASSDV